MSNSARKRIYDYIKHKGIGVYSGEELRDIGKISDWARVIRQLSQDRVIKYKYVRSNNSYIIQNINDYTSSSKRSGLTAKTKFKIRNRDGHLCQSCGKGVKDGVKLHVDHKIPIEWGGNNNESNLWTLCDECNLAKKSFFKDDFDPKVMKSVSAQSSGYQKLKVLFENSPNKKFPPSIIQGISGIRDWTRAIRTIRNKEKINIKWFKPTEDFPDGYYSNIE